MFNRHTINSLKECEETRGSRLLRHQPIATDDLPQPSPAKRKLLLEFENEK